MSDRISSVLPQQFHCPYSEGVHWFLLNLALRTSPKESLEGKIGSQTSWVLPSALFTIITGVKNYPYVVGSMRI